MGLSGCRKQSRPLNSILRTIQSAQYFLHPLPSSPLRPNYRHLRLYLITSNRPTPKGLFLSLFLVIPAIPFSKEFHPQGYHRTRSNHRQSFETKLPLIGTLASFLLSNGNGG